MPRRMNRVPASHGTATSAATTRRLGSYLSRRSAKGSADPVPSALTFTGPRVEPLCDLASSGAAIVMLVVDTEMMRTSR